MSTNSFFRFSKVNINFPVASRQTQVDYLGSEAVYKRVNGKLANLEVDPFFYWEQIKLYNWRFEYIIGKVLNTNVYRPSGEIGFVITQSFDQYLKNGTVPEEVSLESRLTLAKQAWVMFRGPFTVTSMLLALEMDPTNTIHINMLKNILAAFPHISSNVKLAIQSNPERYDFAKRSHQARSLGDSCMRRVLELELVQDGLPLTLQEGLERGPGSGKLQQMEERMMERLETMLQEVASGF